MSISTRQGDDGSTSLLSGQRVAKDHPRVEAVGALDELNVELGGARVSCATALAGELLPAAQAALVLVMGEVATPAGAGPGRFARIGEGDLALLDKAVAELESRLPKPEGWAMPGANAASLALERARVAARRAERRIAALGADGLPRAVVLAWINRLSDTLWLLAREAEAPDRRLK